MTFRRRRPKVVSTADTDFFRQLRKIFVSSLNPMNTIFRFRGLHQECRIQETHHLKSLFCQYQPQFTQAWNNSNAFNKKNAFNWQYFFEKSSNDGEKRVDFNKDEMRFVRSIIGGAIVLMFYLQINFVNSDDFMYR